MNLILTVPDILELVSKGLKLKYGMDIPPESMVLQSDGVLMSGDAEYPLTLSIKDCEALIQQPPPAKKV